MIEYRPIRQDEVDMLTLFALDAMPDHHALAASPHKVRAVVQSFADGGHYQCAAFKDGRVVAGVAMWVAEMPFHDRCEGHVAFCFAREPGTGYRLLRDLMKSVKTDMRIRRVQWAMNPDFDRRLMLVARRLGFQSQLALFTHHKE